jgi:Flp pilus assembly protein TadB
VNQNYALFLGFAISFVALFSCVAVASWAHARRREREALYKSEAIKKVAEMQGTAPESLVQLLREALTPKPEFPKYPIPAQQYRREREAYYRSETLKKVAEMEGTGASTVLEFLREEERNEDRRRREGVKLGGLLTATVGVGLLVVLHAMVPGPVYIVGLIPALIGVALLVYAYVLAPRYPAVGRS